MHLLYLLFPHKCHVANGTDGFLDGATSGKSPSEYGVLLFSSHSCMCCTFTFFVMYKDQYYSLWKVTVFLASREAPVSDDEIAAVIPSPHDCCEMDRIPFFQ